MNLSTYFQNLIAGWLRGTNFPAAPVSLQIGLSVNDPLADGSGILEPASANGYARKAITFSSVVSSNELGSSISNLAQIVFGPVTNATWSNVRYVFIMSGTNLIAYGPLNTVRSLPVGDTFALDASSVQVRLHGAFGKYFATSILNWVRGTAMPAAPVLRLALSSADPLADLTGLQEVTTADGYARHVVTFAAPTYVPDTGTIIELAAPLIFGPAVLHNWPQLTHGAIVDPNSNPILVGAFASPRTLTIGDALPLPTPTIKLLIR